MERGKPIIKKVNKKNGFYLKTELKDGSESIDFFTIGEMIRIIHDIITDEYEK